MAIRTLEALANALIEIHGPNQALRYRGPTCSKQKYDQNTGKPYFTEPRDSELTIYGKRAEIVMDLIENGADLAAEIKTHIGESRQE